MRAAALAALRARVLADARFLPTALTALPLVAGRTRGRPAVAVLREAVAAAPADLRDALFRAPDRAIGRTAAALHRDNG